MKNIFWISIWVLLTGWCWRPFLWITNSEKSTCSCIVVVFRVQTFEQWLWIDVFGSICLKIKSIPLINKMPTTKWFFIRNRVARCIWETLGFWIWSSDEPIPKTRTQKYTWINLLPITNTVSSFSPHIYKYSMNSYRESKAVCKLIRKWFPFSLLSEIISIWIVYWYYIHAAGQNEDWSDVYNRRYKMR